MTTTSPRRHPADLSHPYPSISRRLAFTRRLVRSPGYLPCGACMGCGMEDGCQCIACSGSGKVMCTACFCTGKQLATEHDPRVDPFSIN